MSIMQADRMSAGATSPMRVTEDVKEGLVAYAEGVHLGELVEDRLDQVLLSYIDGDLDDGDTSALEALMRSNANVARLVADETATRQRLERHLSFLFGQLDVEDSADVQRMIESDPDVAKMDKQLRAIADRIGSAIEPSADPPLPPDKAASIHTYLTTPAPEAAPIDHYGTLLVYAAGMPIDRDDQRVVDGMIDDYVHGELDSAVAQDLEDLMRLYASVARLVADRAEQAKLDLRVAMFLDGLLDAEESADVRRLIRRDPEVAKLAHEFRKAKDYGDVTSRPILDRPARLGGVRSCQNEPVTARPIHDYAALVAYAYGKAIDAATRAALDGVIAKYIGGDLDRATARTLEAAMRLSPGVGRMVADRTGQIGARR